MIEQERPGKIFIGGLTGNADKETLENSFAKYGRITEILIIRDKITNQSRGFGFITYENPLDAEDAVKGMDGQTINGKEIHVEPAVTSVHDDRGSDRGPQRSSRGGLRSRGGPSMRSPRFLSSRRPTSSSRDTGRRDMGRRISPAPRRGSIGMRSRGRGGPPMRGRSSSFGRREVTPPRKAPLLHSSSVRYSDGPSVSRRGPSFNDSPPPRRMSSDFDRRDDRYVSSSYNDRLPPRGRDPYQSSPPRDSGRGLLDSRISSTRTSRDYQSGRDYPPQRSYNSRPISPEPVRSRPLLQRDSYSLNSSRDDRRDSFSRGNTTRDYPPARSSGFGGGGGDYISSRSEGRDYASRDYGSSGRDFQSNRDLPSRDYGGRFDSHDLGSSGGRYVSREMDSRAPVQSRAPMQGRAPLPSRGQAQRSYDSYDDPPPSRSYNGPGSRGPPTRSGPSFNSRTIVSSDRREGRSDSGGLAGSRRPGPPSSRGPPIKRSRMDGPPLKREGAPMRR